MQSDVSEYKIKKASTLKQREEKLEVSVESDIELDNRAKFKNGPFEIQQ